VSAEVGVVVPVYGEAPYLPEALDSVLSQDPAPAEVVVVDDGSPDPVRLHPTHAGRCRLLRREHNGGCAAARATGLASLRTPLVAPLDADDAWQSGKLRAQLDVLDRHPEVVMCFGRILEVDPDGQPTGRRLHELPPGLLAPEFMARTLFERNPIRISSAIVRRSALEAAGGFDEPATDDLGCWMRLARGGGHFFFEPRAEVRYRRHTGALSEDIRTGARIALAVQEAYGGDLDPETRGRLRRDYLTLLARGEIRKRRYAEARRALREAERAAPLGVRERALGVVAGVPGLRAALGRRDPHRG
jgi:glycosyltransferase involved in cell wall biosynthesis